MTIRRAVLPTNLDFSNRDKMKRPEIYVQLPNITEAVRLRFFIPDDMAKLLSLQTKERLDYIDFCKRYPDFKGIFHAQRSLKSDLITSQLSALDFIQNIPESENRLIHQKNVFPTAQEAVQRIQQFTAKSPKTKNIPLLDMAMAGKNKKTKLALRTIIEWLVTEGYKDLAFIYRGSKKVVLEWDAFFKPFLLKHIVKEGGDVYIIQVPTKAGRYTAFIDAFLRGATKIFPRTGKPFKYFPPLFLEPNAELKELKDASPGVVSYNGLDRLAYLKKDGRKSYVSNFARWDRLVQANELCRTRWIVDDLRTVPELVKAISYLSQ